MDGLSAAASVIAVAQIAIQLGQGISKIRSLLRSISDAPIELQAVIQELESFDSILSQIRRNEETFGSQTDTYTALERCETSLESLSSIAESLVPGFASNSRLKRKWAAIDVVRKNDKIIRFKAKLQEAKLDLLIAQQTSAAHAHFLSHKTNQESFTMLNQGLAELCEKLTYSSSTVTPSLIGRESVIPSDVSTEIHHAASIWGNRTLQSGLETQLTQVVQNTFNNVMVEHGQENVVLPFGTGDHLSPRLGQFQERRGRRIVNSSNRVTRTPLGEMRCTVSTYRLDQDTTDLELEEVDSEENLEIETTFSLVPSWWIVKFGMARMFKFDIMQFSRQGWQATMSTFNLVPSDSAIFDFCREGNLNAVRSLLRHGKASTRDITPTGLTPLHVAASCCDVDICALLLREGADPSLREHSTFNMTPFEFACQPGDISRDLHTLTFRRVPSQKLDLTIRQFSNLDHGFENVDRVIHHLINLEGTGVIYGLSEKTTSMWIMFELIPVVNPYVEDTFWQMCLDGTLQSKWGHSTTEKIMSHCDEGMIQRAFVQWIHNMIYSMGKKRDGRELLVRDFNLLRERSGGLHFSAYDSSSESHERSSLLFLAMKRSWSFTLFRDILDRAGIDRQQFVEDQITSFDDGWTRESLAIVFDEPPQHVVLYRQCCGICKGDSGFPVEVPWNRRLSRIKSGVGLTKPLSEDEIKAQKEWDDYLDCWRAFVCSTCRSKGLQYKESPDIRMAQDYANHWISP